MQQTKALNYVPSKNQVSVHDVYSPFMQNVLHCLLTSTGTTEHPLSVPGYRDTTDTVKYGKIRDQYKRQADK